MSLSRIAAFALLLAGILVAGTVQLTRADEQPKTAEVLAPLDALVPYIGGEWKIQAKWSNGTALQARESFEWGVGKKFIVCKTLANKPDGSEYQRYETVFGVKDGKLMAWGFVYDGSSDVSEFKVDGKKLSSTKPMRGSEAASPATLHQSIELVDANKFRWVVVIDRDGKSETVMDGMWIRESSASAQIEK